MLNGEIKLQPNNSSLTKELHGWVVYATASKVLNYDWTFSEFDPQWWYFYLSALVPKQRNRTELSWKADAKRNEKTFTFLTKSPDLSYTPLRNHQMNPWEGSSMWKKTPFNDLIIISPIGFIGTKKG